MDRYPIAETTDCDFKVALETEKPKSWLKSVSAFANTVGGKLIFGVSDKEHELVGVKSLSTVLHQMDRPL